MWKTEQLNSAAVVGEVTSRAEPPAAVSYSVIAKDVTQSD